MVNGRAGVFLEKPKATFFLISKVHQIALAECFQHGAHEQRRLTWLPVYFAQMCLSNMHTYVGWYYSLISLLNAPLLDEATAKAL